MAVKIFISSFKHVTVGLRVFWLLITLALLGEVTARLHSFGLDSFIHPSRYFPASAGGAGLFVTDDYIRNRLRPNNNVYFKGQLFTTNSWGWRGKEITLEKNLGTLRIAVLGASITMGSGVADDETFTYQLKRILSSALNKNIEVINMGVGGSKPDQILSQFERYGRHFQPDLVLLSTSPERLQMKLKKFKGTKKRPPKIYPLYKLIFDNSFLAVALREAFNNLALTSGYDWKKRARRHISKGYSFEMLLQELASKLKGDGIPVVLNSLRRISFSITDEHYKVTHPLRRYMRVLASETENLNLIDTYDDLGREYNSADRIYPGDTHPNAAMHRIYAEHIAKRLIPLMSKLGIH